MSFDPAHLWAEMGWVSKSIFLILLVMGVASLYVGIERLVSFTKARSQSRLLAEALTKTMGIGDIGGSLKLCTSPDYKNSYLGHLLHAGLQELEPSFDRNAVRAAARAIHRQNSQEQLDLRKGMNILATVGSTAPFVGLVGTIFGIINAFVGMAESGSGGLSAVSAGIAEALVATAVGIFVAIVGVWLFNFFTSRLDIINNDVEVAIDEFNDWAEKKLLRMEKASAMDMSAEDMPTQAK